MFTGGYGVGGLETWRSWVPPPRTGMPYDYLIDILDRCKRTKSVSFSRARFLKDILEGWKHVLCAKHSHVLRRCFLAEVNGPDSEDCNVLVLEDKSVDGYQMFSGPDIALDAEHCRFVLKRLALWHATSMALNHHEPETAQKLAKMLRKDEIFTSNENHPLWDVLFETAKRTSSESKFK